MLLSLQFANVNIKGNVVCIATFVIILKEDSIAY